mmetsp:Transcript_61563/g.74041  ORF Transcript_61563/g.74041 Transcript_61563/m.74041 type:complete len:228 (-) Transcript_61563:247-930(-)
MNASTTKFDEATFSAMILSSIKPGKATFSAMTESSTELDDVTRLAIGEISAEVDEAASSAIIVFSFKRSNDSHAKFARSHSFSSCRQLLKIAIFTTQCFPAQRSIALILFARPLLVIVFTRIKQCSYVAVGFSDAALLKSDPTSCAMRSRAARHSPTIRRRFCWSFSFLLSMPSSSSSNLSMLSQSNPRRRTDLRVGKEFCFLLQLLSSSFFLVALRFLDIPEPIIF